MLPSTGYFKTMSCPFYEMGFCERPFCHFKHRKKEDPPSSVPCKTELSSTLKDEYKEQPESSVRKASLCVQTNLNLFLKFSRKSKRSKM